MPCTPTDQLPDWAVWVEVFYTILHNQPLPLEHLPHAQTLYEKGDSTLAIAYALPPPSKTPPPKGR